MYGKEIRNEYERWLELSVDGEIKALLSEMAKDEELLHDSFYRHLSFGTGGLRGKLGAGTNRMNVYTVGRASLGLAKYLKEASGKSVAIGYDTRIKSREFAELSAEIFSSEGLKVYLYSEPLPTPMLSYAVRELKADAGVMITASHNPSEYNGYKVYGSDGCQITDEAADKIISKINATDYFDIIKIKEKKTLTSLDRIEPISDSIYQSFLKRVSECSMLFGEKPTKRLSIIYTPLNGTGYKPVTDVLKMNGYNDVTVVSEQASPDGLFPTCKKPNPELDEALSLGVEYLKRRNADILIATDPDCDRVGVVINDRGNTVHLNGNEVGLLLLDYILGRRRSKGILQKNPLCIKTIVTSSLAERIAKGYGATVKSLLTGFKYIGEEMERLAAAGLGDDFVFGFEESCGYLGGMHVRDKDGVYAALLISEMSEYYKEQDLTLNERLAELYKTYGYCKSKLVSYDLVGELGANKIKKIMKTLRADVYSIGNYKIASKRDYLIPKDGLPSSDVIELVLSDGSSVTVRPSGTEPKIKLYFFAYGESEENANAKLSELLMAKELSF